MKHFKYSEAVAYSRISALKILNTAPEAATALSAGEVNVTTLSLTQSFIRKQEKESGEKVSLHEQHQKSEKEILEKPNLDSEYSPPQKRSPLHLKESKENAGRKEPGFFQLSLAKQSPKTATQGFSIKSSRYISRQVKRNVLRRSQGRCEHIHYTGQRCTSQFQLQFDHVLAHSKGGGNEFDNIQNLCRVHNAYKSAR